MAQFWQALLKLRYRCAFCQRNNMKTDGGIECMNAVLEQYLHCFVNFQQDNWVDFLAVAKFVYNNTQHISMWMFPFMAKYGYNPCLFFLAPLDSLVPAARNFLQELEAVHWMLQDQLNNTKEDYKKFSDWHQWSVPPFTVGNLVWLSTWHLLSVHPSWKLDHQFLGPFPIEAVINSVVYSLILSAWFWVHPDFHQSAASASPQQTVDLLLMPILVQGQPEFKVECIVESHFWRGCLQYLVDWKIWSRGHVLGRSQCCACPSATLTVPPPVPAETWSVRPREMDHAGGWVE